MTTHRRDKDIVNAGVIRGLRMEPQLAQKLCEQAKLHTARPVGRTIKGDVAEYTRYLLRTGLGWRHDKSDEMEAHDLKPERLAGLVLETAVMKKLRELAARQFSGNSTAAARHLLRTGLGMDVRESLQREERFAALALALREIRETY